MQETDIHM